MFSVFLLASSALGALFGTPVRDGDDVRSSSVPNRVACASAFVGDGSGSNCVEVPTCAAQYYLRDVQNSETEAPISLEPGRVVGTNTLQIVVQHAAVLGRTITKVTLAANNSDCNYPGPYWSKGTQTNWAVSDKQTGAPVCRDTYISNVPWSINCGMTRNENETHVSFNGQGLVEFEEPLGSLDGMPLAPRLVASGVKFALVQPKVVRDIATTVRIIDDPRLLSAVTRQVFEVVAGNASVTIALSLIPPLRTTGLISVNGPTDITVTESALVDDALCPDNKNSICLQRYRFTLDPKSQCQVDGVYNFTFAVACHPSIVGTSDCPTAVTANYLSTQIELDSEDYCQLVQGLLAVNGTITPHGEFSADPFAFGPIKSTFFQNQTMHFQVTARSLNGFPFALTKIITVEALDKAGVKQKLFGERGGATSGWAFAFNEDPSNVFRQTVHKHHFSYVAAPDVFGDVERNMPVDSDVVVALQVEFVNPIGPGKRKRFVVKQRVKRQILNQRNVRAATRVQLIQVDGFTARPTTATTTASTLPTTTTSATTTTSTTTTTTTTTTTAPTTTQTASTTVMQLTIDPLKENTVPIAVGAGVGGCLLLLCVAGGAAMACRNRRKGGGGGGGGGGGRGGAPAGFLLAAARRKNAKLLLVMSEATIDYNESIEHFTMVHARAEPHVKKLTPDRDLVLLLDRSTRAFHIGDLESPASEMHIRWLGRSTLQLLADADKELADELVQRLEVPPDADDDKLFKPLEHAKTWITSFQDVTEKVEERRSKRKSQRLS
jgi:hypothetical protein